MPKIFAAALFIVFSSFFTCKSDTGAHILVNIVCNNAADTASLVLPVKESPKSDTIPERMMIMGGVIPIPCIQKADSTVKACSNYNPESPGTKMKGEVKWQPDKSRTPQPHLNPDKKIMGDVAY